MNIEFNKKQAANFYKMSKNQKNEYIKNIVINSSKFKFPTNENESKKYQYKFWNSQPCIKDKQNMIFSQPIYDKLDKIIIPTEFNFDWCIFDKQNEKQFDELIKFVDTNMNNDDNLINYIYDKDYLEFLLGTNNLTICLKSKDKIVGTIVSTIKNYRLGDKTCQMSFVKLMCLDKNYRGKRFCEILINLLRNCLIEKNIHHSIYLTNRYIPIPNSKLELYYRPLNFTKLYEYGFYKINDKYNENKAFKYNLDKFMLKNKNSNIIRISDDNINTIYELYCEYMQKFCLYDFMTNSEFYNWVQSKNIHVYGIIDDNNIVDFFIFNKCVLKYGKYNIPAANLLLYSNVSIEYTITNILDFISQTAFNDGAYLLLLSNNFENSNILEDVDSLYSKTNIINYINLYNWQYTELNENQIGLI